jgi:hypothetical protein
MQASLRINARCAAPAASAARRQAPRLAVAAVARPVLAAKARASSSVGAAVSPKGLGASRLASRTVVSR